MHGELPVPPAKRTIISVGNCQTKEQSLPQIPDLACSFQIWSVLSFSLNILSKGHRSLMVTVVRLESGICKDSGFVPTSVHLVFFVLSASETGLLLVVKLGRNVVMMRVGVKIMQQSNAAVVKLPNKKYPFYYNIISLSKSCSGSQTEFVYKSCILAYCYQNDYVLR